MTRGRLVSCRVGFLLAFSWLLFGCAGETSSPGEGAGLRIAVIPKGTTHAFWQTVEAGTRKAAKDLGVTVIWKGPLKENDRAHQIAIVEQFVTEGVDGIVLAPLDENALVRPVRAAAMKGIPVVIFDSALAGEVGKDFVSFVATDNTEGGRLGGEALASLLGGRGKVVLMRYQVGSASTTEREEGFLQAIRAYPGIEVLVDNQYGGTTSGETLQKAEELLDVIRRADGVFCPNESSTYGMLVALRKHGLAGRLKFVGFDASDELLAGLETGEVNALVIQNPLRMAYLAVQTVVEHIQGKEVPPRIDTGVRVITREDLSDPEVRQMIGRGLE
jgi:ribose transport system substrate-binding protein